MSDFKLLISFYEESNIFLDKTLLPSETRIFLIKNPGKHTVRITSMTINSVLCSGYGFRILDCRKFSLLPNQSREVCLLVYY